FDGLKLLAPLFTLIPRLQSNKEEGVITGPDQAEQTETNHAGRVLDPRGVCKDFLHLSRGFGCAFLRSSIRELHVDIEVALIFIGKEAGGYTAGNEDSGSNEDGKQREHEKALPNHNARPPDKANGAALPIAVKDAEESPENSAPLAGGFRPEQQPGKGRAERECIESREHY